MWENSARFILRQRIAILIVIGLLTALMGYYARFAEIRYDFAKMLPSNDSTFIEYENFKKLFGEDGNVLFAGITDNELYKLDHFNAWYDLGEKMKQLEGVEEVVSVARLYNLTRNDSLKKFDFAPILNRKPKTQTELDSLRNIITGLPFYSNIIYNPETQTTIMFITMSKKVLDNKKRNKLVLQIEKQVEVFKAFSYLNDETVFREIALYKLPIEKLSGKLEMILRKHHAQVVALEPSFAIVEKTGHEEDLELLLEELKLFDVLEYVRSGRVAISKPMVAFSNYLNEKQIFIN